MILTITLVIWSFLSGFHVEETHARQDEVREFLQDEQRREADECETQDFFGKNNALIKSMGFLMFDQHSRE